MSTINASVQVQHQETGISFSANQNRSASGEGFSCAQITVNTGEEQVAVEYPTPRQVMIRLLSGDDLKIGTVSTVHPFRLSGANDFTVLRLDVEGRREISTVVCGADTASSLSGDYFDLTDRSTFAVRVWFNMAATAAFGSITYGVPVITDTVVVNGTTFTKVAATPAANEFSNIAELNALITALASITSTSDGTTISIVADAAGTAGNSITLALGGGNTGTLAISGATLTGGTAASTSPATPASGRLLPVVIAEGATAAEVATATQLAIDADAEFSATVLSSTVSITDTHTGTRTNIADGTGTTGWTSTTQGGSASPIVYLQSVGTSQVVVAVAPN